MQVTIAQQLGLDVSTVANFFMNARRRGADRWKEGGSCSGSNSGGDCSGASIANDGDGRESPTASSPGGSVRSHSPQDPIDTSGLHHSASIDENDLLAN
jgi:hypothetical protein